MWAFLGRGQRESNAVASQHMCCRVDIEERQTVACWRALTLIVQQNWNLPEARQMRNTFLWDTLAWLDSFLHNLGTKHIETGPESLRSFPNCEVECGLDGMCSPLCTNDMFDVFDETF